MKIDFRNIQEYNPKKDARYYYGRLESEIWHEHLYAHLKQYLTFEEYKAALKNESRDEIRERIIKQVDADNDKKYELGRNGKYHLRK